MNALIHFVARAHVSTVFAPDSITEILFGQNSSFIQKNHQIKAMDTNADDSDVVTMLDVLEEEKGILELVQFFVISIECRKHFRIHRSG